MRAQTSSTWRVLANTGAVHTRAENAAVWNKTIAGQALHAKATLRTGSHSSARLGNDEGRSFSLPAEAQIEIHELDDYSRDEVVLALTALELQRLPTRKDSIKSHQSAFILHGALPDSLAREARTEEHVRRELNGAFALFEQGYYGGFILKWHRLLQLFPRSSSQRIEAALIQAYEVLEMPLRAQQARERFAQKWN